MSYHATGYGYITFSGNLPEDIIKKIQSICDSIEVKDTHSMTISPYCSEDSLRTVLTVSVNENYDGGEISGILRKLSECAEITEGEIEFSGEDGSCWRFIWHNQQWIEQNGQIVYEPFEREFGKIVWTEQDIRGFLSEHPEYPQDDAFFEKVLARCMNNTHFTDDMISTGWNTIAHLTYDVFHQAAAE